MKKKILSVITVSLAFIFILIGCSSEQKGVPESVVLHDTSLDINSANKYNIVHNVDSAAHTDDVELIAEFQGEYGTMTVNIPYFYQYDRTTDIWTLVYEGKSIKNLSLDEEAFKKHSPWSGVLYGWYKTVNYSITFNSIDLNNGVANITYSYSENYGDSSQDFSGSATVECVDLGNKASISIPDSALIFELSYRDGLTTPY